MMRSESALGSKHQFALDPSSQISSDPTQASLLLTKLGSMGSEEERELGWDQMMRSESLNPNFSLLWIQLALFI